MVREGGRVFDDRIERWRRSYPNASCVHELDSDPCLLDPRLGGEEQSKVSTPLNSNMLYSIQFSLTIFPIQSIKMAVGDIWDILIFTCVDRSIVLCRYFRQSVIWREG